MNYEQLTQSIDFLNNKIDLLEKEYQNKNLKDFDKKKMERYVNKKLKREIKGLAFLNIAPAGYEQRSPTWKGFDSLWARGYYIGSAGHVSQDAVKRYIQEQEGKKVFEYDIYECPEEFKGQLKIGDYF